MEFSEVQNNTTLRTLFRTLFSPAILSPALRHPSYAQPYSQAITAIGGTAPYTFALVSGVLPRGLSFSSSGVISGTPTNNGSWTFTVRVTDSTNKTFTRSFTLSITSSPAVISIGNT